MAYLFFFFLKGDLFYIRKAEKNHRIAALKAPVFFFLPDRKIPEQIPSARIIYRKEVIQHTHGQGLPKAPGAGDQGHVIPTLPPFLNELCLVYIEKILLSYLRKILQPDPDPPRHMAPPIPAFISPTAHGLGLLPGLSSRVQMI